jgi:hypothetical protein
MEPAAHEGRRVTANHNFGAALAGPSRSELGMARLNHDVLATEVRYGVPGARHMGSDHSGQ